MKTKKMKPVHPGEILLEEYLKPLGLSQYKLAKEVDVSPRRINEIIHGTRSITADTALRLGKYFSISPEFWLNLQTAYDLKLLINQEGKKIQKQVHPMREVA